MNSIKDFIYLDIDKVSSLYSQLTGGIIQSIESSSLSSENNKNIRNYDLKIFKHEAGGTGTTQSELKETRVSHHDIYNELEKELFDKGYAIEIGKDVTKEDIQNGEATEIFEKSLSVKVEGRMILEDYEKLIRIAENHNDLVDFINQSIISNLKKSSQLKEMFDQIEGFEVELKSMKNGSKKTEKKQLLNTLKERIDISVESQKVSKVDTWIFEGMKKWISVFLPNIFTLRLYPFDDISNFHIMSNLKKEAFLENDVETIHYLFGSKPTINVTLLGVITDIPKKDEDTFSPMKEFEEDFSNDTKFESAFRGAFRGFDGLENLVRTCRYPRIMVQPIAIFREVKPFEKGV